MTRPYLERKVESASENFQQQEEQRGNLLKQQAEEPHFKIIVP
jgi:hypothetical protein